MATFPLEDRDRDDDGDGTVNWRDPDSAYYAEEYFSQQRQNPGFDDDNDGIKNSEDTDSVYYQKQLQARQAQQTEQQTIALQEQAEAAQAQTVVIATGLVVIVALLLVAVFVVTKRKKSVIAGSIAVAKKNAATDSADTPKVTTPELEERSGIKTAGVWLVSLAIIYFISAMMLGVFGLSVTTNPISRLGSGLSGLAHLGMMVASIAIATYWKNGKLSAKINGGNGRIKNEWWKYAIGAGFAAWLLLLIAVYI